ncbi:fructosamine kinase family protein [Corynebacterium sp.]|uniref:fructosamine kinase family protein n=1 Tax=Corynebacterium sp. TaxID=1720 RepID=UPI0026DAC04C|nr:fructosamine kinase family protein [Corynebacterium sp.]MDO5076341.1 fructosamine kinase family protein [Corynebacterium sp.]
MHQELPEELIAGLRISDVSPVHGGDIAKAFRLEGPDGTYFLKTHRRPQHHMFEREARGLAALRSAASFGLGVPEVLAASPRGLLLEWIEQGQPNPESELEFGRALARMHKIEQPYFGGLAGDDSGYIGSVQVDLTPAERWPEFYVERRVRPLIARAIEKKVLSADAADLFERLSGHAPQLCGPEEPPALVHGDLWGGNRLVGRDGKSWLIDPAAHYAHREVDVAMMLLFGGFGDAVFVAYQQEYPLAPGWRERVPWYQLPPLLVHAILFGGGYGSSALGVLKRLVREAG